MFRTGVTSGKFFWVAVALWPALAGCSAADGVEPLDESDDPLYIMTPRLWSVKNVPVCWGTSTAAYPTEKRWVREILHGQRSWEHVAGVRFKEVSTPCATSWPASFSFNGIAIEFGDKAEMKTTIVSGFPTALISLRMNADVTTLATRCVQNGLNREQCIKTVALHELGHAIGFAHEQQRPDTPPSCTAESGGSISGDTTYGSWDLNSVMNYCGLSINISPIDAKGAEAMYRQADVDVRRQGDFNGDGRDDLLCHDALNGDKWIAFSGSSGVFGGSSTFAALGTCSTRSLYVADVNGDGRDDLLCHDPVQGGKWVDFASTSGAFGGWDFGASLNWCNHESARLLVGEFTGDGRADLLCHDAATGWKWVDWAVGTSTPYGGTDWSTGGNWCSHASARIFVGDFNGNGRDDLLCHDVVTGQKWIDYVSGTATFAGTDWSTTFSWCAGDARNIVVGDFNGDGRDDLLCHDTKSGGRWVDLANTSGQFGNTDATGTGAWCNHVGARLYVGDFNNDDRDDLLCHDVQSGTKWVDYAVTGSVIFGGTDASWSNGWCNHTAGELH